MVLQLIQGTRTTGDVVATVQGGMKQGQVLKVRTDGKDGRKGKERKRRLEPMYPYTHLPASPPNHHASQVDWTVPKPLEDLDVASQSDGETRAYIRAYYSAAPGLFTQSEVFTLESAMMA